MANSAFFFSAYVGCLRQRRIYCALQRCALIWLRLVLSIIVDRSLQRKIFVCLFFFVWYSHVAHTETNTNTQIALGPASQTNNQHINYRIIIISLHSFYAITVEFQFMDESVRCSLWVVSCAVWIPFGQGAAFCQWKKQKQKSYARSMRNMRSAIVFGLVWVRVLVACQPDRCPVCGVCECRLRPRCPPRAESSCVPQHLVSATTATRTATAYRQQR